MRESPFPVYNSYHVDLIGRVIMTVVYHEEDGDIDVLHGKVIGIIGYGNLGRPVALNLHDSGVQVKIGVKADESTAIIESDGLPFASIEQVARESSVILMMIPDEVMPQ